MQPAFRLVVFRIGKLWITDQNVAYEFQYLMSSSWDLPISEGRSAWQNQHD